MKKQFFKIYFWIGVNVIGIPEISVHEINCFQEVSRFFGTKNKIAVNQFNTLQ